jgi:hypothetical protein
MRSTIIATVVTQMTSRQSTPILNHFASIKYVYTSAGNHKLPANFNNLHVRRHPSKTHPTPLLEDPSSPLPVYKLPKGTVPKTIQSNNTQTYPAPYKHPYLCRRAERREFSNRILFQRRQGKEIFFEQAEQSRPEKPPHQFQGTLPEPHIR